MGERERREGIHVRVRCAALLFARISLATVILTVAESLLNAAEFPMQIRGQTATT
jgi:hypothetical protein